MSITDSEPAPQQAQLASAAASTSAAATIDEPRVDQLVLDAGPLLARLPLRGMAKRFYMPPDVLAELKDQKAREHLDFLKLSGLDFQVREGGPEALTKVIAFAKQTGDYSVLSRPDLSVLALAYALEVERHGNWRIREELGGKTGQQRHEAERQANAGPSKPKAASKPKAKVATDRAVKQEHMNGVNEASGSQDSITQAALVVAEETSAKDAADVSVTESEVADDEEVAAAIARLDLASQRSHVDPHPEMNHQEEDDNEGWTTVPSSSRRVKEEEDFGGSDGEGDWITADNISNQKQKDLGLVTDETMTALRGGEGAQNAGGKKSKKSKGARKMTVAAMSADYAVQNVLLQMGMALVSSEGMRIEKVRSWVLRCHACFKLCKDSERKFCPSCGNATLIRTSVTSAAPGAKADAKTIDGLQIHLKKNFQYRNRGTIYSIPLPKPGSASGGKNPKNANPILREDQPEWERAVKREKIRQEKEQRALDRALEKGKDTISARYEDPDWLPGMLMGDSRRDVGGLPDIGAGRRNPNQARHTRRRK